MALISAEHGIGQKKRDMLKAIKDETALDMMRMIKTALDPKGIMNPAGDLKKGTTPWQHRDMVVKSRRSCHSVRRTPEKTGHQRYRIR